MVNPSKTIFYYRQPLKKSVKPKSKRPYRFLLEQGQRLRKKVLFLTLLALFFLITYLLIFSEIFKIKQVNIASRGEITQEEVKNVINEVLANKFLIIFPRDNYFLLNKNYLNKKFQEHYPLSLLEINKKFPNKVNLLVTNKLGQAFWLTREKIYLIDLEGKVIREISNPNLLNNQIPIIYDLANSPVSLSDKVVDEKLANLIFELHKNFSSYQLPSVEIGHFALDNPEVNYVKLVTKQGFEIHLNVLQSLESQIDKLKKSLLAGKIDLNKIQYINLRIPSQVIYK